jgi:hypothetical protein
MKNHYCWPEGYWYDTRFVGDDPFISNKNYSTFNADQTISYCLLDVILLMQMQE